MKTHYYDIQNTDKTCCGRLVSKIDSCATNLQWVTCQPCINKVDEKLAFAKNRVRRIKLDARNNTLTHSTSQD